MSWKMGLSAVLRWRAAAILQRRGRERVSGSVLGAGPSRGLASDHPTKHGDGSARGVHSPDYHDPSELTNTPVSMDYIPGTDSYSFGNPYPKLNKGRLDWLFGDGWRRPPTKEEGQQFRSDWMPFGFNVYDEYDDWRRFHLLAFGLVVVVGFGAVGMHWMMRLDWPSQREWCRREAFFELERRRQAGLPLISKHYIDPERIVLPAEDELTNFDIII